jgi:CheY-like chemotaxis protein
MAGIDGYELCWIIKNNPRLENTPAIIDKVKARKVVDISQNLLRVWNY